MRQEKQDTQYKKKKPDIRYVNDMKEVMQDKKWAKQATNTELYYMYRGVSKNNDLRYDITVIPPKMLGKEFVKTKGHYHTNNFAELYIVLRGKAIYLAQQKDKQGKIKDVFVTEAKAGEAAIMPQGCGHITINPGTEELVMGNWISENCMNDYGDFTKKHGACYYYIKSGKKNRWIKNKNYGKIPQLRFKKSLEKIPKNLDFLKES